MKILIVITRGDSIGGAQTHVLTLAKILQKHHHQVLVCYGGEIEGPFNDLLKIAGINFVTVPSLKREISPIADLKSVFNLRRIYNEFTPDIVSLHSSKAGIIGRLSGIFSKIPIVFTAHGWAFTDGVGRTKAAFYKFIEKSLSGLAAKIIVVSHYDKKIALENNIANDAKIEVVHNGIAVSVNERKPIEGKKITNITMIARFDEQKDHETLIRACVDIDNIKIHFLGDGPGIDDAIALTNKLEVSDKFEFYGYTNRVEEVLETSDIFALISNWEGFPMSTLEAMNYGLPVVISDVGGAKEAVVDGETGYVIKRKDVQGLKTKLLCLINTPGLCESMGVRGKKLLVNRFSSEIMYDNTMRVFYKALK